MGDLNRPLSPLQERRVLDLIFRETVQLQSFNGSFMESFDALATSDGATVTMTLEKSGGGDLTMQFSDGISVLNTDPATTLVLTPGTDQVPGESFVYIPLSTKVLTESTSTFPVEEHIRVAHFILRSAATTQTEGTYGNQNWNDHASVNDNKGHIVHLSELARLRGSSWHSGGQLGVTIVTNGGSPDNVFLVVPSAEIYQLHKQITSPLNMATGDAAHVINHNTTPHLNISDLNTQLNDAAGVSMTGRYFNIFVWGVANKTGTHSPIMCQLPIGSYSVLSDAIGDVDGFDVLTLPSAFDVQSSTAWPIARITLKHSNASGGTWTLEHTKDLRTPTIGGGTSVNQTVFTDSTFKIIDDGDSTKIITFQASGLTTSTTRVYTMQDADGTLAFLTDVVTDHGALGGRGDDDHTQYHTDARALLWAAGSLSLIGLSDVNSATLPIGDDVLVYNSGLSTWLHVQFATTNLSDVDSGTAIAYDVLSLSSVTGNYKRAPGGIAQLFNAAGVTTVPAAFGAMPWDSSPLKVGNFTHSTSTNNSEITCLKDGFIEVDVNLCFLYTSGGGNIVQAELQLNSGGWATVTGTARREQLLGAAGGSAEITINFGLLVTVDDKIRIRVKEAGGVCSMPADESSFRIKYTHFASD